MKATRLQRGWRLNLSDSEMDIICEAVAHLQGDWIEDADIAHLEPSVKAAWRRSFSELAWPSEIDDRRK